MKITNDHVYMLTYYITVLSSQYAITNVQATTLHARKFKQVTNTYINFLEEHVYNLFKDTYELNEGTMEKLFTLLKTRNEFQMEEFVKDLVKF